MCSDGRQDADADIKKLLGVDVLDRLQVPGTISYFGGDGPSNIMEYLLGSLKMLIDVHRPSVVALVWHHDCAQENKFLGRNLNVVEGEKRVSMAAQLILRDRLPVHIVGLVVDAAWKFRRVIDIAPPPKSSQA